MYLYFVDYTEGECYACGQHTTKTVEHILATEDCDKALCGASYDVTESPLRAEHNDLLDICPLCNRLIPDLVTAQKAGFDTIDQYKEQHEIEKQKYQYWMRHGSLVGFVSQTTPKFIMDSILQPNNERT